MSETTDRALVGIRARAEAWREKLTAGGTDNISVTAALGMLADIDALLAASPSTVAAMSDAPWPPVGRWLNQRRTAWECCDCSAMLSPFVAHCSGGSTADPKDQPHRQVLRPEPPHE